MRRRMIMLGGIAALGAGLTGAWLWRRRRAGPGLPAARAPVARARFESAYHAALPPPEEPLRVYHLGHSLVGRDMPLMLAQLAGHDHASQLGWGTPLRAHWEDGIEIAGFEGENAHPAHLPARPALASGRFDVLVLTEMVELRDAIRWHAGPHYLARWAAAARAGNPEIRVFLYETWHALDTPEGWLARIDRDLVTLWEGEMLQGAMAWDAPPIHLIPGGQVIGAAARAAEAGQIPGLTTRTDFFARDPTGKIDPIHLNDLGHYLIALTHYAVLYQRPTAGLPHDLALTGGRRLAVPPETATALQALVWQTVRATPGTGIAA